MRLLDRVAGLETEYAIRFRVDAEPPAPAGDLSPIERTHGGWAQPRPRLSNFQLYQAVIEELKRLMPLARANHSKRGFFLANGGAVWLEKGAQGVNSGLVEGATPECRGPRRLVAQQRAQDALLAAAARDVSAGGEFVLCKSDCDAWARSTAHRRTTSSRSPTAGG